MVGNIEKRKNNENTKNLVFVLLALMLSFFCILKVIRGSDSESTAQGGIWNYISLLYYPVFLFLVLQKDGFRPKPVFLIALCYLFFAVVATFANFSAQLSIATMYNILMVPYPFVVFFSFYLASEKAINCEKIILFGYFVCLLLNLYSYARSSMAGEELLMKSDIYFSLGLFPFALQFLKRKSIKTIAIVIQFLAVFLSDKRTALISFVIALVLYFLINTYVKNGNLLNAIGAFVIIALGSVVFYKLAIFIDGKFGLGVISRLLDLSEDGGSGRLDIYSNVWNAFNESSLLEQLFGHGMNASAAVAGAGKAHNDFLQILYDYGAIAFLLIVLFYFSFIVDAVRLIRRKSVYAASFVFSIVIGLFLAMLSYFIVYFTYVTCIMAFWGYVLKMKNTVGDN